MKKLIIPIHIILILLVVVEVCAAHKTKKKGVVDIVDARKTKIPDDDARHHAYHDVVVYRTGQIGNQYEVHFYSNDGDSLFCYQATWEVEKTLTNARYKWENDTLVDIQLYSNDEKKKINFKVFGAVHNGVKTEGMITED